MGKLKPATSHSEASTYHIVVSYSNPLVVIMQSILN